MRFQRAVAAKQMKWLYLQLSFVYISHVGYCHGEWIIDDCV